MSPLDFFGSTFWFFLFSVTCLVVSGCGALWFFLASTLALKDAPVLLYTLCISLIMTCFWTMFIGFGISFGTDVYVKN
jgi:hypothetical protein